MILTELKVMDSIAGQTLAVYPLRDVAVNGQGVTTVPEQAINHGKRTVVERLLFLTGNANHIGPVELWDVDEPTGPRWAANYNEQPNVNPISPSGATPSELVFGPYGLLVTFGIGLRTVSGTARVRVLYREVVAPLQKGPELVDARRREGRERGEPDDEGRRGPKDLRRLRTLTDRLPGGQPGRP